MENIRNRSAVIQPEEEEAKETRAAATWLGQNLYEG
jgi:hypothetical protein